jgi:hypothetical protein
VTRRRYIGIASGALLVALALAAFFLSCTVNARGSSCSAGCKAAYGNCYKKSQDRARCQAQLQRCLESCIRSRK